MQVYLARIDAYDKRGPAINAITVVNPDALATADSLDRRYRASHQFVGPLHCIPMIVKDNFQTIGLQTAAGNLALGLALWERTEIVGSLEQLGANIAGMLLAGVLVLAFMRGCWTWVTEQAERVFGRRAAPLADGRGPVTRKP